MNPESAPPQQSPQAVTSSPQSATPPPAPPSGQTPPNPVDPSSVPSDAHLMPLEGFFTKLPPLPLGLAKFIATVIPIILVLAFLMFILALIPILPMLFQFDLDLLKFLVGYTGLAAILALVKFIISLVLSVWSLTLIPELFDKKLSAWRSAYKIQLIYVAVELVIMIVTPLVLATTKSVNPLIAFRFDGMLIAILMWFISFYILVKIKPAYH